MMTPRENLLSLLHRTGYEYAPVEFNLCPDLMKTYYEREKTTLPPEEYFAIPWRGLYEYSADITDISRFDRYYSKEELTDPSVSIDDCGVGHRKTPTSMHMTQMLHPLANADSVEQIEAYPLSGFTLPQNLPRLTSQVEAIKARGLAAMGSMQCTVWETAWYLRGMENLMMDMMSEDDMATSLLDKVTEMSLQRAVLFAKSGADMLFFGDDIGMQSSIMMSESLYCDWLKPRIKKIIDAAKAVNPDILVFYHSCGFVEPFIPHLIEVGVDVLNPVQPECMEFSSIHEKYGDRLSFHGVIGTQTTMPFGTPAEVRHEVERVLTIAGDKGGLFAAPTHLLEPEVPWENVLAYIDACKHFKG